MVVKATGSPDEQLHVPTIAWRDGDGGRGAKRAFAPYN